MRKATTTRREERKKTIKEIGSNPDITGTTEMYKMKALNGMIEDLEDSINNHSRSTNRLSVILVIATVIIALVGIVDISYRVFVKSGYQASQASGKLNE
ncbi:MAG: hypothetical protein LWX51_02455 [Deltaproteobacteria bacterium]|jgi:hypothetical protein|nr:hypothetical protein [Deltaproteobacteria bacterium]